MLSYYFQVCSGQSNMAFAVSMAFNASEEIAAAANYPFIRLFTLMPSSSDVALNDIVEALQPWAVASPLSVGGGLGAYFSAIWFVSRTKFLLSDQRKPGRLCLWANFAYFIGMYLYRDQNDVIYFLDIIGVGDCLFFVLLSFSCPFIIFFQLALCKRNISSAKLPDRRYLFQFFMYVKTNDVV